MSFYDGWETSQYLIQILKLYIRSPFQASIINITLWKCNSPVNYCNYPCQHVTWNKRLPKPGVSVLKVASGKTGKHHVKGKQRVNEKTPMATSFHANIPPPRNIPRWCHVAPLDVSINLSITSILFAPRSLPCLLLIWMAPDLGCRDPFYPASVAPGSPL